MILLFSWVSMKGQFGCSFSFAVTRFIWSHCLHIQNSITFRASLTDLSNSFFLDAIRNWCSQLFPYPSCTIFSLDILFSLLLVMWLSPGDGNCTVWVDHFIFVYPIWSGRLEGVYCDTGECCWINKFVTGTNKFVTETNKFVTRGCSLLSFSALEGAGNCILTILVLWPVYF